MEQSHASETRRTEYYPFRRLCSLHFFELWHARFSKKEKKACNYCHTKIVSNKTQMAKDLNDTGNCYKNNDHSLTKCASK